MDKRRPAVAGQFYPSAPGKLRTMVAAMQQKRLIWKIRTVKGYPEAHNHQLVGEVLEQTPMWVRLRSRTFHFGHMVSTLNDIKAGPLMTRIIPWNRVEVIHELNEAFDFADAKLVMGESGNDVTLEDGTYSCRIFTSHHRPY